MADYTMVQNKSIALVVWNSEDKDDAHVYLGAIVQKGEDFYFVSESQGWNLRLEKDKLDELKEVTAELKEILLNADLCLIVTIASLPDGSKDCIPTGMKWHK